MGSPTAGVTSSGSAGEGIFNPFLFTYEAGELEDFMCITTRETLCKRHESCLLCAALRDVQTILEKRETAKKAAQSVRELLDDPQCKVGWDATDPAIWPTKFVWAINTCVKLRKELSHYGAVEIHKEAIRAAANTSGMKGLVVEASWTRGAPPSDVKELKEHWRALKFVIWKDMGNTYYASWFQNIMPFPWRGFVQEDKFGDMLEALLGIRWLLHLNWGEGHPLREGRNFVGQEAWEDWLMTPIKSWVPLEEGETTTWVVVKGAQEEKTETKSSWSGA